MNTYPTLIHERVDLARREENETVICRLKSGWVVLGDNQLLKGYSLLLADPIQDTINSVGIQERTQFLLDMAYVGDALLNVLSSSLVNYSILGNRDRALHAHIQPRYDSEPEDKRNRNAYIYQALNTPPVPFDYARDSELIQSIRKELAAITDIIE